MSYDRSVTVYVSVSSQGFDRDESVTLSGPGCVTAARREIERYADKLCGELAKELLRGAISDNDLNRALESLGGSASHTPTPEPPQ